MSITETKLFKNRVESPELVTTELVTNNILSSHLQAESAIINGLEITPELFDGQEITFHDVIDVKEQLRSKGLSISSIQAEQIVGFTMKIYGRFPSGVDQLEYITLNRKDTTGDAEALSTPVFMYIKCLGVDGSVIDTIFSNDAVQQVSGDFNATTWRFSNFVLKEEYDTLEIRFSTVQGQQQTNIRVRSTNLQQTGGKKLYIQGWDSIYPSSSGVDKRNYTTDFTVGILTKIPNIQAHARNTEIHLDYDKREKIKSIDTLTETVNDFTSQINERMSVNENDLLSHKGNTNVHITDEQKRLIANTSEVLNAHKNNADLHLNQNLKNQITNNISNVNLLSSRITNINTVLNVRENFFTTMREGLVATEAGKTYAHGIQLTKKHFISGTVKSIEIPYKSGENAEFYLAVQIFYENETQSTTKTLNQTYFSQESQQQPGGDGVCAFTFKNLTIPQKYKFVRLIFAQNKESVPNLSTLSNCVKGRVRVLSLEDNNGDYTSFDDDECKLLPSGNYVAYINATTVASVLDQVANRYVPGSNIEINDLLISVPTTDVLDQSTIIPTSNAVYTALETTAQEIRDEIANIEISDDLIKDELPNTNGGLGEKVKDYSILGSANSSGCQGIAFAQICAEDVITEVSYLKRIVVPQHPNATDYTNANVYLVIYGDTTGSDNWVFVGHSKSTALQQVGGEDMVFEFDNDDHNINLGDYKKYRFFYVQDVTTTPQMPSGFGNSYRGVKMAFPSRNVNTNCLVQQAGGGTAPNHAYPAIITYDTVIPDKILHKDNEDRHVDLELKTSITEHIDNSDIHLTSAQKESINKISAVEAINEALGIETGEYYKYSFDTPISPDYQNDKETLSAQMIRFGKLHFPTGHISEIELPYEYGKSNVTVYLAVQVVKNGESKDIEKTAAETVYSSNTQSQAYRAKGTSVFKFDNLIIPDDYQYVRLAFVPNTSTVPTYKGNNCTMYGITVVDLVSDTDDCRLMAYGLESRYGVQCRVKYVKSTVTQQITKDLNSTINSVDSKVTSHIGDASHLTDAQKSAISQISTISSDFNSHKTNGGTLHVTADDKSNWNDHVDDDTIHVTAAFKKEISDDINANTVALSAHTEDEDIHFSKSEIMDNVAGSLEKWDMSLGVSVKGAQGIAYAQICNNHVLQEGSYLTKIVVPQHTSPQASEVTTGVDLYLVIFGDNENSSSSDETKWQFVTCSTNEGQQQIGGNSSTKPDLVFEFEKGIDLGLYRRYRFFYVTDRTVTPTLPTVFGSGYTGVKMAFPSRGIDADCKVRMTGGGWATSHTFPAIIHFIKDSAELRSINHKDNDEKHLTVGFRDTVSSAISKISEIEDKINDINFVLGVEKQEYTTFSSELPVPTDITNHDTTQILLASSRCVSGKIKKIEIPYTKGKGTTGYLAVQIIHSGESANIEKTLEDTYFSTETQTQTNNQSGVSTFYFDNLFIPSDFYAIRLSFVSNKNTAPNYGGSNCLTYAIRMVSITESDYSNLVHNHDGYKIFNPANQGYSYSNTDYGVIVSVESVKSSFDFITGELYRLKKVIS